VSKQIRLEALSLAVKVAEGVEILPLAAKFADFIEIGELDFEEKMSDDVPALQRGPRNRVRGSDK